MATERPFRPLDPFEPLDPLEPFDPPPRAVSAATATPYPVSRSSNGTPATTARIAAGAVIGYRSPADATPDQVLSAVEARVGELIRAALGHPAGPLAGACEQAGGFLRSWWGEPPGPPFAPAQ